MVEYIVDGVNGIQIRATCTLYNLHVTQALACTCKAACLILQFEESSQILITLLIQSLQ